MTAATLSAIPLATYRLQLHHGFTFVDAQRAVPYLHALGITDCYLSPISKATPGSDHGYDVIDPVLLNPELGSEEDFQEFVRTVQQHGLGIVLDVVPNHMGIGKTLNRWWRDVLENGPSSRYATAFDIDWHPIKRELENKVLLPILADQYGAVLESQEIELTYEDGAFFLRYYEDLDPHSLSPARSPGRRGGAGDARVGTSKHSDRVEEPPGFRRARSRTDYRTLS
jgi:(1->4)-alpha-D-glucan 1-alpha-D-glucosylmutase